MNFWGNPKVRSWIIQALTLVAVVGVLATIANNTAINLQRQGIASGFDFFGKSAGFDIIQHLIPYSEESTYGAAFVVALLNTLLVSVISVVLATILGFLIGIARLSSNWLVAHLSQAYIEIVRNIPMLLQLFFWYFAVLRTLPSTRESFSLGETVFLNIRGLYVPAPIPAEGFAAFLSIGILATIAAFVWVRVMLKRRLATGHSFPAVKMALLGVPLVWAIAFFALGKPVTWDIPVLGGFNFSGGLSLLPELVALLVTLTTYTAAFIAEIVRAGILAVNRGQWEASLSLGLTRGQTLRFVVVPQAMRVIVPPMTNQYLNLTKNSSLAAAIAYPDLVLVFAGTVLMQTGQAVEVIALTMGVYLALSLLISGVMNQYNRRVALVER